MIYTDIVNIRIQPIGTVINEIKEPLRFDPRSFASRIVIHPRFCGALEGIEKFSHIDVIFWLDRIKHGERRLLRVHPYKDTELPLVGVFATRSPARPNPIGLTTVELVNKSDDTLIVKGLDAVDNTPVLDIKPHIPWDFEKAKIAVPEWVRSGNTYST